MSSKYDYQQKETSQVAFALGVFVVASAGAFAAMLFAPKSVIAVREQLKDEAGKQQDKFKHLWGQTKTKAALSIEEGKEKFNQFASQTTDRFQQYSIKAKGTIEAFTDRTRFTSDDFDRGY